MPGRIPGLSLPPIPPDVSIVRLIALIVGPVFVFCVLATVARIVIYTIAILSAFGKGSLTQEEAPPLYVIAGVVAFAGATVTQLACERWALHATHERTPEQRAVTRFTRTASFAMCVALVIGGPPLIREIRFQSTTRKVTARTFANVRQEAISDLGWNPSPRAFDLLRRVALDTRDNPDVRRSAVRAMRSYPEALPVLLTLAEDAHSGVRADAGSVLLGLFADDDAAWAMVERLARDDSPAVRDYMLALLKGSSTARAPRLLKELLGEAAPPVPGPGTFDGALAILMDVNQPGADRLTAIYTLAALQDERALEVFRTIVTGQVEPGFMPPGRETGFRQAARESVALFPGAQPEWTSAFDNEQHAVFQVENLMRTHLHYRRVMGVFEPCMTVRASCVPGREYQFLPPRPLEGYIAEFHAGAPTAPADIMAKKASATSVTSFAYVALPEVLSKTGMRGFCADDTGRICFTRDGRAPTLEDGHCPGSVPLPSDYAPVYPDTLDAPRECRMAR